MYARVCRECSEYHQDIIQKKINKGCITGVMLTTDKDECYLEHMHEEEGTVPKNRMKVKFKEPDTWTYSEGVVDLQGYSSLLELLNNSRYISIELSDDTRCINTDHLICVWENTDND